MFVFGSFHFQREKVGSALRHMRRRYIGRSEFTRSGVPTTSHPSTHCPVRPRHSHCSHRTRMASSNQGPPIRQTQVSVSEISIQTIDSLWYDTRLACTSTAKENRTSTSTDIHSASLCSPRIQNGNPCPKHPCNSWQHKVLENINMSLESDVWKWL